MQIRCGFVLWVLPVACLTICGCGGGSFNPVKVAPVDTTTRVTVTTLPGGSEMWANDINDDGRIAGTFGGGSAELEHPVVWDAQGNLRELPPPQGVSIYLYTAQAINAHGQIAGYVRTQDSGYRVVVWEPDGTPTVRCVSRYRWIYVHAINKDGVVVGSGDREREDPSVSGDIPVVWTSDKEYELHLPNGCVGGAAYDINDSGLIVGGAGREAVVWHRDGSCVRLERPKGAIAAGACGVNNLGVIVGMAGYEGRTLPVVWDSVGKPKCLGLLPDCRDGGAYDINDRGQIVGTLRGLQDGHTAVMWNPDGSIVKLGPPEGMDDSSADAINNNGWIVGTAEDAYGRGPFEVPGLPVLWKIER